MLSAIVVLAAICLGSGAGVGSLYWSMKDDIEAQARGVFQAALAQVLGEADGYAEVGQYPAEAGERERVYAKQAPSGALYAAMGSAKGYGGPVRVLVSVRAEQLGAPASGNPTIHAMTVVESQETPGLGENIRAVQKDVSIWAKLTGKGQETLRRPWFQEQFSGLRLADLGGGETGDAEELPVETGASPPYTGASPLAGESGREVEAITGATITSSATVEAVRGAVRTIIEKTAEAYAQ
ncbi:MAG: FMN-binding protein [Planctomycetota bacterium]